MRTQGGISDWMQDWHDGSVEKSAHRARREQAQQVYCTITAVVTEAEVEDVLRTLARHPGVMSTGVDEPRD